jgi:hypothetical protein
MNQCIVAHGAEFLRRLAWGGGAVRKRHCSGVPFVTDAVAEHFAEMIGLGAAHPTAVVDTARALACKHPDDPTYRYFASCGGHSWKHPTPMQLSGVLGMIMCSIFYLFAQTQSGPGCAEDERCMNQVTDPNTMPQTGSVGQPQFQIAFPKTPLEVRKPNSLAHTFAQPCPGKRSWSNSRIRSRMS